MKWWKAIVGAADLEEFVVTEAIGGGLASQRPPFGRSKPIARFAQPATRANLLTAVLALAGVVLPSELQITIVDGARFTPGRVAAIVLIIPALVALFQNGRRWIPCDALALATGCWMVIAALGAVGTKALPTSGEALDFLGGYLITRAFCFGRPAIDTFVRVLKTATIIVVICGMADQLSGRLIVHDTIRTLVNASEWPRAGWRNGHLRAAATFDHEILFGVFCALSSAVFLYWETSVFKRLSIVGVCFVGCLLSFSSAAVMAFFLVLAAYMYDKLMRRFGWRWKVFWLLCGLFVAVFVAVAQHPLGWLISHLTFDPQTGYFRMIIWDAGFSYIAQAPLFGYGYELFHDVRLDGTVDSIWLLQMLRFGIPMFVFFFLTNLAAILPSRQEIQVGWQDRYLDRMRRAFTLLLLVFMFSGLTVHFWNYMWMFWGVCLGVRASLQELSMGHGLRVNATRF